MNNQTTCNKCGEVFDLTKERYRLIVKDGLEVSYFVCPFCLTRYHYFTSNAEMRSLIEKRKAMVKKIQMAKVAKVRTKTLRTYQAELIKIKRDQLALAATLSARGAEIMAKYENPSELSGKERVLAESLARLDRPATE